MRKQLLKHCCAVFLAGFIALLLLPQAAQAQSKEAYVVKSSDKKTLTFYYDDQKSSRAGSNVWGIEETKEVYGYICPAWSGAWNTTESEVTTAVFDASFKNYLPKSTEDWFSYFENLKKIEGLTNLNTSEVTTMRGMFYDCLSLTSLDLSNFKTENVQYMSYMFYGCSSLTSLDLSNFKTENVQNMSEMFRGCNSLQNIYCNNTWTCSQSWRMFSGCTNLKGAVVYNSSKVDASMANPETGYFTKKVREAYVVKSSDKKTLTFYYDDQKSSRTGSNVWGIEETKEEYGYIYPAWSGTWKTTESEVTTAVFDASFKNYLPKSTENWFSYFENLKKIEGLTNFNTSEVTTMRRMFVGCSSLTSLDLSNFKMENVQNMSSMFSGCESLTSLDLSNFKTENVQNLSEMFYGCKSLTSLNLSNFKTENVQDMSLMFYGCSNLTSLNLSNFKTENVQNMSSMFRGCSSLTSLNLSNFKTENVQNMSSMFYGCKSLTSLNLSSFKTENVQNMSEMFEGCSSLTSLNLSNFNTENVKYMSGMFRFCSSLTSLNLSNFNTENVQNMSSMFYGCNSLQNIYCNNTWTCSQSGEMFSGCTSLQGAVDYDSSKTDASMANPETGYFTKKGITGVATATTEANASIQTIYSTDGRRLNELQRGLNIVRMSNGTTQKILRK